MKAIFVFFLSACLVGPSVAADPCAALGVPGFFHLGECRPNALGRQPVPVTDLHALASVVVLSREQAAEIQALRAELKVAHSALTEAVNSLNGLSKKLSDSNVVWRRDALEKTVSAVTAMPSLLANDSNLRAALMVSLKADFLTNESATVDSITNGVRERLIKDASFIEALRK